jgi:hypothetical protein
MATATQKLAIKPAFVRLKRLLNSDSIVQYTTSIKAEQKST